VNKDLFSNPFINPIKRLPLSHQDDAKKETVSQALPVPQKSLEEDEVKVKSLFDFKQNAKYLKTDEEGARAAVPLTKGFQFNGASTERGLIVPVTNPFTTVPPVFA